MNKFINTFDYSLDLIKLRDVYTKVFRRTDFSFWYNEKEYSKHVINVTFNYSVKEYNKLSKNIYVKNGYSLRDIELDDCLYIKDGELVAIQVGKPVTNVVSNHTLGKYFYYDDGMYKSKTNVDSVLPVANLRRDLYENGFICDGIKYIRFKRSAGSARVGKCLFINEKLYYQMHKWEMCGLKVKENQEVDLAALESYISLTSSSIIDTIEIDPASILVVDDFESTFNDVAAATDLEDGGLVTTVKDVSISNSIWDGQSLIQSDTMGDYSQYGMVLLRQRFFKSCCFNCDIQKWFSDNNITNISQLNGYTLAKDVSEIRLITTPSSLKYLKFGSLDEWLHRIDSVFGVVKHEKKTHFFDGRMVMTHYQLINTLPLSYEEVQKLLTPSFEFLKLLKTKPSVVKYYIKYNKNAEFDDGPVISKNDIVYKLLNINSDFHNTKLYRDWLRDLTKSFTSNLRKGKILINGNYSTLLGNPVEMLQQSIGKFDGTSQIGVGNVFSKRFDYDKQILGSRSPHVTMGNILTTNNRYNADIDKYFNITEEIICINSIGENILECLSGSDFDSDTLLLTDNEILLNAALRIKGKFPVPTRLIKAQKTIKKYNAEYKADLDIKTSVNKIGEIINLSQELNSLYWNKYNEGKSFKELENLYCDIATLDVMSNMEIDKAKKLLPVDNVVELKRIKNKYIFKDEDEKTIKPKFFEPLARSKGYYTEGAKNYKSYNTSMDYLQTCIDNFKLPRYKESVVPFSSILKMDEYNYHNVKYDQIKLILDIINDMDNNMKYIWQSTDENLTNSEKYVITSKIKEDTMRCLSNMVIGKHTMFYLLKSMDDNKNKNIKKYMMSILFGTPNKNFYELLKESSRYVEELEEIVNGNIYIFDFRFVEI